MELERVDQPQNLTGAVLRADTSTIDFSFVIDEDDMASDLDTKVPTQQSVKAYVDAQIVAGVGRYRQPTHESYGGGAYLFTLAGDPVYTLAELE